MKELRSWFAREPVLTAELVAAAFFSSFLALASALYVMQVLNRYVAQGVDSTLVTLTTGAIIAVLMEYAFRQLRHRFAEEITAKPFEEIASRNFTVLVRGRATALDTVPPARRREITGGIGDVESAYSAGNINTMLDVPFSLLFLIALFMINGWVGAVAVLFIGGIALIGWGRAFALRRATQELRGAMGKGGSLLDTVNREIETVRAFNAADYLSKIWGEQFRATQDLRSLIAAEQGHMQSLTQTGGALMGLAVVGLGAFFAVKGQMDVGMIIGGNILASRALQPIAKLAQLGASLAKAHESLRHLHEFEKAPVESEAGSARMRYAGGLEFRDLAFMYQGAPSPLFESLSLEIKPGALVVVIGDSGSGKTTLARLILGIFEPVRGRVLADGMDLRQVAPEWWRRQIAYLPQEPTFFNATIGENLKLANPDIDTAGLNRAIDAAGLRKFLDESAKGFDTPIIENGRTLAVGVRRELALARAVASEGRLVVFDEIFDGLDDKGRAAVNQVLNEFVKQKRTVVIMSHRANIIKGIDYVIDLNFKPCPKVTGVSDYLHSIEAAKGKAAS